MSTRIKMNDLTEDQKKTIRKCLYLQPKKTNFSVNNFSDAKDPILFYWIDKPNGEILLPYTFANSLMKTHLNSKVNYPPGKFEFIGKLRDYQIPIVNKALEQLNNMGTTTLLVGTGLGKSIMAAYLSSMVGGLTLVLTNRETIQTGWIETFKSSTNAALWTIESKMKIPSSCNVILTMDGKFGKIPWEIRKMVSVLIIDEAHLFCTPSQVSVLLGTSPKYIIVCTATLERPDGMHSMIHSMVGMHQVEVKNNKPFIVYKLFTGIRTEITKNKYGNTDWPKLVKDIAFDPKRNASIINLIEKNKNYKIMVLSWSKLHVDFLTDMLRMRGESVDKLVGNKSTYIDSRVLVGSISKISTGFDSKNVAINFDGVAINMLLLVGSTKAYNLHVQSIGRVFRSNNPVIIDFVDDNRISKNHWNHRRKNYESMNCIIHNILPNQNMEYDIKQVIDLLRIHSEKIYKNGSDPKVKKEMNQEQIKNINSGMAARYRNRVKLRIMKPR